MQPALSIAAGGAAAAFELAGQSARQIVTGARPAAQEPAAAVDAASRNGSVVSGVTGAIEARVQLGGSLAVMRAADRMTGALLDIVA